MEEKEKNKIFQIFLPALLIVGIAVPTIARAGFFNFSGFFEDIESIFSAKQAKKDQSKKDSNQPVLVRSLKKGESGKEVIKLQKLLDKIFKSYDKEIITGYFGEITNEAIKNFQRIYDLRVSGKVNKETRSELNKIANKKGFNLSSPKGLSLAPGVRTASSVEHFQASNITLSKPKKDQRNYSLEDKPSYDISKIETAIFREVNDFRRISGKDPLKHKGALSRIAEKHSNYLAKINKDLVSRAKHCDYPLLIHEGFNFGSDVVERLKNSGLEFQSAGENLALFPLDKNLIYRYRSESDIKKCKKVKDFNFDNGWNQETKKKALKREIKQRKRLLKKARSVNWKQREWKNINEISRRAIRLWKNSFQHRKNMLKASFDASGVGVAIAGDYLIVTQVFIDS
ncbi:MAG: peptidoglycan-binding protein [Candidatus Magasanikbacteria bacterium]